ncbi:MAG TPA: hypothetical protein VEZ14_03645 [Dehalococcoidia bacterium]|nr:hypothetical protein [Dehalococcoidia bacterium]
MGMRKPLLVALAVVAALLVAGPRPTAQANPLTVYVINTNVGAWLTGVTPAAYVTALSGSGATRVPIAGGFAAAQAGSAGQVSSDMAHAGDDWIVVQTNDSASPVTLNGRGLVCMPACDNVATQTPDATDKTAVWHVTSAGTFAGGAATATQTGVFLDSRTLTVVGSAQDMQLSMVGNKTTIQEGAFMCPMDGSPALPANATARAVYTDVNRTELVGYQPTFSTSSVAQMAVGNALGTTLGPSAASVPVITLAQADATVSAEDAVCGIATGSATLTATTAPNEVAGPFLTVARQQAITITGGPATIALGAAPPAITCDGVNSSTVTATVRDAASNLVVDNTPVTFSVVALGVANPIQTVTTNGVATTTVTPFPGAPGDTVIVTSGSVQRSIGVLCSPPPPPSVPHVASGGVTTTVQAELAGAMASTVYRIDLFSNASCTGSTVGGTFLGSFTTTSDVTGALKITEILTTGVPPGQVVEAAATDPYNYESPLSACQTVVARQCVDDTLCNGYTDAQKIALGKDPFTYCSIMRADVTGDGMVAINDLGKLALVFGQTIPPAPARYDQDRDGKITIVDLGKQALVFGQSVSACP